MKILIVDAGMPFKGGNGGALNHRLTEIEKATLESLGHEVQVTRLADGWKTEDEVAKYLRLDAVIYQTPAWWMEAPAALKSYEDDVFGGPAMITGDGRHHENLAVNYGTGGKLKGRYMISSTWNAPLNAFLAPDEFFEGKGIDATFFGLHKANQFIGLKPLPSFMCNDVIKNPTLESDIERLKAHLEKVFGRA